MSSFVIRDRDAVVYLSACIYRKFFTSHVYMCVRRTCMQLYSEECQDILLGLADTIVLRGGLGVGLKV
jgi:hypothetical protein